MTTTKTTFGRRTLLRGAIGAGALAALGSPFGSLLAQEPGDGRRVVLCEFAGGWDVLLGPDARDPLARLPSVQHGTDLLEARYRTPIEVTCGDRRALWGAPMRALTRHADVATVFRGVNMNTVAHNVGQAYMNTGLEPAGSTARGSSLGTVFAAGGPLGDEGPVLPFVAIGTRSYNDHFPREATALRVARPDALLPLLRGDVRTLPTAIEALLEAAREDAQSCVGPAYDGLHPADELLLSRERLRRLESEGILARFTLDADTPEMIALRARYGITDVDDRTPAVRAAISAQLVRTGLSRSVSVRLQAGLDTHSSWGSIHPVRLQEGFDAMAALLDDLREDDPDLARTSVLAFSEFARTPRLNGNRGRDHWFASSVLVFGGLRPTVFGETNRDDLGLRRIDPTTGRAVSGSGLQLRPEHVVATLVAASGGDPTPYRVDPLPALFPA